MALLQTSCSCSPCERDCSWQQCVCIWWLMSWLLCFVLDLGGIVVCWALIAWRQKTLDFIRPHIVVFTYSAFSGFSHFNCLSLLSSPAHISFHLAIRHRKLAQSSGTEMASWPRNRLSHPPLWLLPWLWFLLMLSSMSDGTLQPVRVCKWFRKFHGDYISARSGACGFL